MECLLVVTLTKLSLPYGAPTDYTAFTNQEVSGLHTESLTLIRIEIHD